MLIAVLRDEGDACSDDEFSYDVLYTISSRAQYRVNQSILVKEQEMFYLGNREWYDSRRQALY